MSIRDDYVELCEDYGFTGSTGPDGDWGDIDANGNIDHYDNPCDIEDEPIVLIEMGKYGQTWITLHPTLEAACSANTNQEYAEDWQYPTIIDLRTGKRYEVEYRATPVEVVST